MEKSEANNGKVTFHEEGSVHNTDKMYGYMSVNFTVWHQDNKPRNEKDWNTAIKKIAGILQSHGLEFNGSTKVMGLVEEKQEEKPQLILPPEKKK